MPIINQDISAGSVATPAAGNTTLFTDAGLAYIKQSSGTVLPIGGLTPSGVTPGSYTTCDLTVDVNGIITAVANGTAGGSPGGSNGYIQYNNAGVFGGVQDMSFDQYGMGMPIINIGEAAGAGGIYLGSMQIVDKARITASSGSISIIQAYGSYVGIGSPNFGPFGLIVGSSGSDNEVNINRPLTVNSTINMPNVAGTATLTAGTVTVSNAYVTALSLILVTVQALGTVSVPKAVHISAITANTDFTITSADPTDTSTIAWMIIN